MPQSLDLNWSVGFAKTAAEEPERWVSAVVPGAVQLDWARAENWPPHWEGLNTEDYLWMEDVWWTYRTRILVPVLPRGGVSLLELGGVDYACAVSVDGVVVAEQEGMYRPLRVDLSAQAGREVEVRVCLQPVPKSRTEPADRVQANHVFKPAVSYLWDFHPRLVPLGLWKPARLRVFPERGIVEQSLQIGLSTDLGTGHLALDYTLCGNSSTRLRWTLLGPAGESATVLFEGAAALQGRLMAEYPSPQLWWPHDHGAQPLYISRLELLSEDGCVLDCAEQRSGFRRVRLVMYPGQWAAADEQAFPKPRAQPPACFEINGRRIFAKGANWVAPDIFYGAIPEERLASLLRLARDSHFNILRCWGGAPVMPEFFFALADELGLLVWQEFTLACNNYVDTPRYLAVVDLESRHLVHSLRAHPCLALWCGGNELFNSWSGMDDQAPVLRLLNRNTFELDPDTPFLPTAPFGDMAHGHYVFRDEKSGREVWSLFQEARRSAYSEFGVPGIAVPETLALAIPESERWPPQAAGAWKHHHAFESWTPQHHLCLQTLEAYFGPIESLERLTELSQWTQAEGLRGVYEEARRQQPRCSMALAWCFNEPWPTAANLSLVSWPDRPKPALALAAQACRPVLASARIRQFAWKCGEVFEAELWLLNDSSEAFSALEVRAFLEHDGRRSTPHVWHSQDLPAFENRCGPLLTWLLPVEAGSFTLVLEVTGQPAWCSRYRLLCTVNKT